MTEALAQAEMYRAQEATHQFVPSAGNRAWCRDCGELSRQPWHGPHGAQCSCHFCLAAKQRQQERCPECGHEPHMTGWCTNDQHPVCDCTADEDDD